MEEAVRAGQLSDDVASGGLPDAVLVSFSQLQWQASGRNLCDAPGEECGPSGDASPPTPALRSALGDARLPRPVRMLVESAWERPVWVRVACSAAVRLARPRRRKWSTDGVRDTEHVRVVPGEPLELWVVPERGERRQWLSVHVCDGGDGGGDGCGGGACMRWRFRTMHSHTSRLRADDPKLPSSPQRPVRVYAFWPRQADAAGAADAGPSAGVVADGAGDAMDVADAGNGSSADIALLLDSDLGPGFDRDLGPDLGFDCDRGGGFGQDHGLGFDMDHDLDPGRYHRQGLITGLITDSDAVDVFEAMVNAGAIRLGSCAERSLEASEHAAASTYAPGCGSEMADRMFAVLEDDSAWADMSVCTWAAAEG